MGTTRCCAARARALGVQLSAGQRQLLALARALVWDPALLLLDEATVAIDSASELALWTALRTSVRAQRRAVLTVAHRLATARAADRVIVLDAGTNHRRGTTRRTHSRGRALCGTDRARGGRLGLAGGITNRRSRCPEITICNPTRPIRCWTRHHCAGDLVRPFVPTRRCSHGGGREWRRGAHLSDR